MVKNGDIADIKKNFLNLEKYIDIVLNNDFYNNKMNLSKVNEIIIKWNNSFAEYGSLKRIDIKDLVFIHDEINDFCDEYITSESYNENYSEILQYNFSILERYWKDEMERSNNA